MEIGRISKNDSNKASIEEQGPSKLKSKKRRTRKLKVTDGLLLGKQGFVELAIRLSNTSFEYEKGNEAQLCLRILKLFDNWSDSLCSGMDKDTFFNQTEKLCNTNYSCRNHLNTILNCPPRDYSSLEALPPKHEVDVSNSSFNDKSIVDTSNPDKNSNGLNGKRGLYDHNLKNDQVNDDEEEDLIKLYSNQNLDDDLDGFIVYE